MINADAVLEIIHKFFSQKIGELPAQENEEVGDIVYYGHLTVGYVDLLEWNKCICEQIKSLDKK